LTKTERDTPRGSPLGQNWPDEEMKGLFSIYVSANRPKLLAAAGFLVVAIAAIDWTTKPYLSIGFLYLFPIILVGGFLSRARIIGAAFVCAFLQEAFSNLPGNEATVRLIFSSTGFIGTGLLVSELIRNRRTALKHVDELTKEINLRHDAEEQMQILVESSPAAIVTIDATGTILLANHAAQQLFAPDAYTLSGQKIISYLPALQTAVESRPSRSFRTTLQCKGQRSTGDAFLAGVWFSTYTTISGPRLAAVVVDLSEDLRDREDLSLDYLLKNSRILVSAVAHEVRNLCGAALVVQKNLSRFVELRDNKDFQALTTLIQSLERISAMGLQSSPTDTSASVELMSVLDELRVLIEGVYQESGIEIRWELHDPLPLVRADRHGLIQVFLNLARNSRRAMEAAGSKQLYVNTCVEGETVVIRFEDTGTGVSAPDDLFRPFQPGANSTGLGLYVSRAIMRSFGGDLLYVPRTQGCCFAVIVPSVPTADGALNA
jgi:two-component system sensor kinase FixL